MYWSFNQSSACLRIITFITTLNQPAHHVSSTKQICSWNSFSLEEVVVTFRKQSQRQTWTEPGEFLAKIPLALTFITFSFPFHLLYLPPCLFCYPPLLHLCVCPWKQIPYLSSLRLHKQAAVEGATLQRLPWMDIYIRILESGLSKDSFYYPTTIWINTQQH